MKTIYRAALMAAAFVFLLPLSARSEIKAGSFELEPFGGYNIFQKDQNLKDTPEWGGRLSYNFTRHFGIEGAVEFMDTNVDNKTTTGRRVGQFTSPMNNVHVTFYHADLVYTVIPDGNFNPFVLVGYGETHYNPKISTHNMDSFNVGVGAKYWVADHVALRVDVRDYMPSEVFQEIRQNYAATLGITFAFGGTGKPGPKPVAEAEAKPEPKAEEPVVIVVSEPKAEEKVTVIASEPKIEEKVIVLALEDVHFDFDKSTLTKQAQEILKKDLKILQENPKAKVRIAGYTSASGTEEYNQKLSERRANAVKDYLVKEGIVTPDRLSEIGYGKTNPAMYEAAPKDLYSTAAKANMRVLFEISVQ